MQPADRNCLAHPTPRSASRTVRPYPTATSLSIAMIGASVRGPNSDSWRGQVRAEYCGWGCVGKTHPVEDIAAGAELVDGPSNHLAVRRPSGTAGQPIGGLGQERGEVVQAYDPGDRLAIFSAPSQGTRPRMGLSLAERRWFRPHSS